MDSLVPDDLKGDPTALAHPEVVDLLHGVVWSRLGNGQQAWAWWDRVREPGLQSWLLAERGRVVRELGLHERAERFDAEALERATKPVDMVRARIGLVADAVGNGRADVAADRLTAVDGLLDRLADGPEVARQRLRRSWVTVEVDLMRGEDVAVDELPEWGESGPVLPADYASGTTFHRAKGLLFAGVVRNDPRLLDAAAMLAPPVLRWAVHLARADQGVPGAMAAAADAWAMIVPPGPFADAVAATPTAQRLMGARRR